MKNTNLNSETIKLITPISSLAIVSAMGGLLFGYDWVVIGSAKSFYELYFNISSDATLQGWAMSGTLLGCILGAVLSGFVADRLGRIVPLIFSAFLFTVSSIGTGYVDSLEPFILYRLLGTHLNLEQASFTTIQFLNHFHPVCPVVNTLGPNPDL